MKKLNIIFALIISSFFLLSSNVKADVINFNISSSDITAFGKLNDTFFKAREAAINLANTKNKEYYIFYSRPGGTGTYQICLVDSKNVKLGFESSGITLRINQCELYYFRNDTTQSNGTQTIIGNLQNGSSFNYSYYLDSSYKELAYSATDNDFTITYNDTTYLITENSYLPSLYELYMGYEPPEQEDSKSEIVTNFYVLIIDKIKLLTNYIATDYIILSALVIFIFVAVIGLVRRLK